MAADEVTGSCEHRRLADSGTSWVAVADDQLLGFVCAERFGPDLHVHLVAVRREAQGRGLGTRLMQTVLDHAFDPGAARVTLTTFRDVPFNEPFYRRLGFTLVAPADLDARLRRTLAAEAAAGMPAERHAQGSDGAEGRTSTAPCRGSSHPTVVRPLNATSANPAYPVVARQLGGG